MLGFFPYASSPYADAGSTPPAGNGTGISNASASGELVGLSSGGGQADSIAAGRVVGAGTAGGESVATGAAPDALGIGSSNAIASGQLVGLASAVGIAFAQTGTSRLVGSGSALGIADAYANPNHPLYNAWEEEVPLFRFVGTAIDEFDAAFEQAGRIVVAAQRTILGRQEIWLYWFDPFQNRFVFQFLAVGRNPRCILDDPLDTTNSDVLVFYVTLDEQRVVYRQQRDRYAVVYNTPAVRVKASYIDVYLQDVVKDRSGRLVLIIARHTINTGRWHYERLESALYPLVLDRDEFRATLSLVSGTLALTVIERTLDVESFTIAPVFQSGSIVEPIIEVGPPGTLNPIGNPVPFYDDPELFQVLAASFQSGTLVQVLFENILYDIDATVLGVAIQSGTLVNVLIDITLYDVDEFQTAIAFQAAGSSLV